jgi:hypothetical protein
VNQIAGFATDSNIYCTYEGDNSVLLQLVAKGLLENLQSNTEVLDALVCFTYK